MFPIKISYFRQKLFLNLICAKFSRMSHEDSPTRNRKSARAVSVTLRRKQTKRPLTAQVLHLPSFFYGGNRLRSRVLERWWREVGARERALKVGSWVGGSRGGGGGSHRCSWLWRGGTVLSALPVPPARPCPSEPSSPGVSYEGRVGVVPLNEAARRCVPHQENTRPGFLAST